MIYLGLIHFNNTLDRVHELRAVLESFTHTPSITVQKKALSLCYGKLSDMHDLDDIWESEASILMGRIFDKTHHTLFEKKVFMNLSHQTNQTKENVLEKVWGKYVYIDGNKKLSQVEIVVDSTGQLPFFYYQFSDGNIVFSSDIEIILKFLSQKPEYNWTYLCSYLIYGNSSAIQTPFKNIYELPPGCRLKISKHEIRTEPFWNPLCSYKTLYLQQMDAVGVLQTTLKPWIEPYKNICVSLSGGLDSSALVYCLKNIVKSNQNLCALNYFHPSVKSSNELIHARKVCQETGIELIEIDTSHSLPFDPSSESKSINPNKPFPGLVSLRWLESIFDNIPSDGSCTFISGHGSDHIFMRPPSKKSVSDYVLEKGLRGSKVQLKNIAQFYRDPVISILKESIKGVGAYIFPCRSGKRSPGNIQDETPDWITDEARQMISSQFVHPIYEHLPIRVLPGKYEQIDILYEGIASINMEANRVNPTHYPFLYKPMVEFVLSFPTYELFNKGYDRYPLRKAVSDHFKTDTVWRKDKSQTTGIYQLGLKKNLEFVLDICLKGQFVEQGFIDKEGLHKTIMLIGNGSVQYMGPFINIISCEIFLKYWEEKLILTQ